MPKRIQRRRTAGWRMPEGAVYVGRGTPWGNPFPLSGFSREEAVRRFRQYVGFMTRAVPDWLAPLRGRDLACFCPLDQPCHADVLLALANGWPLPDLANPEPRP